MTAPNDETKPFIARWQTLVKSLLVDSSVKHVAMTAGTYADFKDGRGVYPSNQRMARETGLDESTVRKSWSAMCALGMAVADRRERGQVIYYDLQIPFDWFYLPLLGPTGGKFMCLHCGKMFNPKGNCKVYRKDEKFDLDLFGIEFDWSRFCFCGTGRCRDAWIDHRNASSQPVPAKWVQYREDEFIWEMFQRSRGINWDRK